MKKLGILIVVLIAICGTTFAQGARSLVINEVLVNNQTNFQDDYGLHHAWIEIFNPTFATVDIRNCYLTNDKRVLDESLSAPEKAAFEKECRGLVIEENLSDEEYQDDFDDYDYFDGPIW